MADGTQGQALGSEPGGEGSTHVRFSEGNTEKPGFARCKSDSLTDQWYRVLGVAGRAPSRSAPPSWRAKRQNYGDSKPIGGSSRGGWEGGLVESGGFFRAVEVFGVIP